MHHGVWGVGGGRKNGDTRLITQTIAYHLGLFVARVLLECTIQILGTKVVGEITDKEAEPG